MSNRIPDDVRQQIEETQRRSARRAELARERWGAGTGAEKMERLARAFPSLRNAVGVAPWDVHALMAWLLGGALTGGNKHAVRFCLQVWNSSTDWREAAVDEGLCSAEDAARWDHPLAPFNVAEAIGGWDDAHRDAFMAWCEAPFHP